MKSKILSLLIIMLFSMGMLSSVASMEFESSTFHTDTFDILEIVLDDLNGDGNYEILTYTAGKKLLCLDDKGNVNWAHESNNSYSVMKILDFYDSPDKEIFIGTENRVISKREIYNGLVYLLNSKGEEISIIPVIGSVLDLDVGDVDSNGTYETIIGADDGVVYLFDQGLDFLWDYKTRGYNFRTVIVDLNDDGKNEIVVVSFDNTYIFDSDGKITNSYVTKNILRQMHLDKYHNMIHVSRWYREDSETWKGTVVYSLNRNLSPMWEFRTETDAVSSVLMDINNDGKDEVILGGNSGELIFLDSKGVFVKRFDLPNKIFKIGVIKDQDKYFLVLGCKDNNLYVLDPETGSINYKFTTGGWVETFIVKDMNNDGKEDILLGSNDNKIYLLLQKKDLAPNTQDQNNSGTNLPVDPKAETKNTPFEEIGILGGTLAGAIYLALRKRR